MIQRDMLVEDLVEQVPAAVTYLMGRGIQAIACGAPIWGTLEEAAHRQGYSDDEIETMVADIRELQKETQPPANE